MLVRDRGGAIDTLSITGEAELRVPSPSYEPRVDRIYPGIVGIDRPTNLVIQGAHFVPALRVHLERAGQRVTVMDIVVDDDGQARGRVRVPPGIGSPLDLVMELPSGKTTTVQAAVSTSTALIAALPNTPTNGAFAFRQIDLYSNRQGSGIVDHVNHPEWPSLLNDPNILAQEPAGGPDPELYDSLAIIASKPYDGVGFTGGSWARYSLQPPQYVTSVGLIGMGGFLFWGTTLNDIGLPLLRMVATFENSDTVGTTLSAGSHIRNWFDGGLSCSAGYQPFLSSAPGYAPAVVLYSGPSTPPGNTVHYDFQPLAIPDSMRRHRVIALEFTGVPRPHNCNDPEDTDGTSALFGLAVWPKFGIKNGQGQDIVHQSQNSSAVYGGYSFGGNPVGTRRTLAANACFITRAAMALTYYGVPCTPQQLNTYLQNVHGGYNRERIAIVTSVSGGTIRFRGGANGKDWKVGHTFVIEHGPWNPIVTVAKDGPSQSHVVATHQAGMIAVGDTGFAYRWPSTAVAGYGFSNQLVRIKELGNGSDVAAKVESLLVRDKPVALTTHNKNGGLHWVLADGWLPAFVSGTAAQGTYRIKDPAWDLSRLIEAPFVNEFDAARQFISLAGSAQPAVAKAQGTAVSSENGLTLLVSGHDAVVITDPAGRSVYLDPATGQYVSDIPGILALRGWTDDDDVVGGGEPGTGVDVFEMPGATDGQYLVRVTGQDVSLSAEAASEVGALGSAGAIDTTATGVGNMYTVDYTAALGAVAISFLGPVAVEGALPEGASGLRVLGSPAVGLVRFAIGLNQPVASALEIYDIVGRLVDEVPLGTYSPGAQVVTWNSSRTGCGAGIYFARMRSGSQTWTARFVLMR